VLRKSIRPAGWGACPPRSAISSNARECKEPSARSFKPVLVGASPTTGAISHNGRVAQPAEALRRERRQCRCKSCRDYHLEPEALIAKPPPFKRLRWVQVPTGSFHHDSLRISLAIIGRSNREVSAIPPSVKSCNRQGTEPIRFHSSSNCGVERIGMPRTKAARR
jgi:hypothetical protein